MTKPTIEVVAKPVQTPFSNQGDVGQVDVTLEKLRMANALKNAGVMVDVTSIVTDTGGGENQTTDTTTGPPELEITIFDRGWKVLNSGVFDQTVDVTLDGVPYRLMEVDILDVEVLQLTFYHKIVALLLGEKSPLVASRSSVTRAQFIEYMLREIAPKFPGVVYVCPEVNKVQPVAGGKASGRALTSKLLDTSTTSSSGAGAGFGQSSLRIRDWDGSTVTLNSDQLHNAALVLQTCKQVNAPAKATLAVMEACLVEPDQPYDNPSSGDGSSVGILQVTDVAQSAVPGGDRTDVVACVEGFLKTGFTGQGSAIALANSHPELSAGTIAQMVQGSAYGSRYDMAYTGATTVINAYQGGSGSFSASGASKLATVAAATKTYNFTRGQPGQTEDSWTCAQRLASEVNWRFFVTGRSTVWFVSDDDLMDLPVTYTLDQATEGVGQITGQIELGNRTVVVHGKRLPKPSEGQVAARIHRWEAQPGSPIQINDYGPYEGQWIITQVDRDLFDRAGTIYFQAPQKALAEPAATSGSSVSLKGGTISQESSSGNPIDRVYAAAQVIDSKDLPYIWAGGHTSWAQDKTASGFDCSGAVSYALYLAGLMTNFPAPITSGEFAGWGVPGIGHQMTVWYCSGHVFIEFYGRPAKRFDTVPGGSGGDGPHLRYTLFASPNDEDTAAAPFYPRHWPGC